MIELHVKLLGIPKTFKDDEEIKFPTRKIEALFYYMIIKKQASRDELACLFWGGTDESNAKKNLRNALYYIKKACSCDILVSGNNSTVSLNHDIHIASDIDSLLSNLGPINWSSEELLESVYIEDCEEFEEWLLEYREHINSLLISKATKSLNQVIEKNNADDMENISMFLIKKEPYNERIYRELMKVYASQGLYNKALNLYFDLENKLKKDLQIPPEMETIQLYNGILDLRRLNNKSGSSTDSFFYGRYKELYDLNQNFYNFINSKDFTSILIRGEAGVGKTRLKDRFLEMIHNKNILILQTTCYEVEESYFFKPWNDIFAKISELIDQENIEIPDTWKNILSYLFPVFFNNSTIDHVNLLERMDSFKYQIVSDAVVEVLRKILSSHKIILIFDDLQWIDDMSLSLLTNVLLHINSKNIMFIGINRVGYSKKLESAVSEMHRYNKINVIPIERFCYIDVENIIKALVPRDKINESLLNKIFNETEGNTLFLVETLKNIREYNQTTELSSNIKNIISSRISKLTDIERAILDFSSLFFDKVDFKVLKQLIDIDELKILEAIESLQKKGLLWEIVDSSDIYFKFTHQIIRNFIYSQQSHLKKRILHNRIGTILEANLYNDYRDRYDYSKLIYHFEKGDNYLSAITYRLKNLYLLFDYNFEFSPAIYNSNYISDKQVSSYLEEFQTSIDSIENALFKIPETNENSKKLYSLKIEYYHLVGRYYIKQCFYNEGTKYINEMISLCKESDNKEYLLTAYNEMLFYNIQVRNTKLIKEYIDLAYELAKELQNFEEIGTILRIHGFYQIMMGNYDYAKKLLSECIKAFKHISSDRHSYDLHIAAAYNYLGYVYKYKGEFANCLAYYKKAINICKKKNIMNGLSLFYNNAGQAYFEIKDYKNSKEYFIKAISLYEKLDIIWCRAITQSYMAVLNVMDKKYDDAKKSLVIADKCSKKLDNPYELSIVNKNKVTIKLMMRQYPDVYEAFKDILNLDIQQYCNTAIKYFAMVNMQYEIDYLETIKNSVKRLYSID